MNCKKYFKDIRNEDGIWVLDQENEIQSKFSDEDQNRLFALEDFSWWFQYRADVIAYIAEGYLKKEKEVFDVGGGNGYTTLHMQNRGYQVALLEPSYGACKNARKRGIRTIICETLEQENMLDSSIPQFMALDVLEHIQDDIGFLRLMRKKLAKKGRILLTVPAFSVLWSSEDEAARHYRRYTIKQIRKIAAEAGYRVCYVNYFFCFLFVPILFVRVGMEKVGLIKRCEKRTDEERKSMNKRQFQVRQGIVQSILNRMEMMEFHKLKKKKKIRFGSSIICVMEKEDDGMQ